MLEPSYALKTIYLPGLQQQGWGWMGKYQPDSTEHNHGNGHLRWVQQPHSLTYCLPVERDEHYEGEGRIEGIQTHKKTLGWIRKSSFRLPFCSRRMGSRIVLNGVWVVNDSTNMITACWGCNLGKNNNPPEKKLSVMDVPLESYNRIWCLRSWKKAVYLVD